MSMHVAAYRSNADLGGAAVALNAVVDQAINTEDTFLRVPTALPALIGEAFYTGVTTAFTGATVQSPSLRQLANQAISLAGLISDDSKNFRIQWHPGNPRALRPGEGVEFVADVDSAAAIELHGVVWLADGAVSPVSGNIFTTRATATITAVQTGWTAGVLTFDERLPIANYDVVGMSVLATDGTLGRLIFPGLPWRPGVVVNEDETTDDNMMFRMGRAGVFGTFDLNQPPQLEVFGGADTAQVVYLDLIQR